MRNIFDQYSQPENRVTHALMTALNEDRHILGSFLHELVKVKPPTTLPKLSVLEQQYPGEEDPSEEDTERRGIPDGWIYDEHGWCVFIETKVLSKLRLSQIEDHRRIAERRGFRDITAVAIVSCVPPSVPANLRLLEWREVYKWLRRHNDSAWANRAADYLEILEEKMIDNKQFKEGTLTKFAGIPFGEKHPYTYLEAKRILALAMEELKGRPDLRKQLGLSPKGKGRGAITGREAHRVWDMLSLSRDAESKNFTRYPHLTLGISDEAVNALVTVPHAVNNAMRRNLIELGEDGFQSLVKYILQRMKPLLKKYKGALPRFIGIQRRYPFQRATPFIDALIDFDLRTAIPNGGAPKTQPRWLSVAYGSFVKKAGANYQIQVGVRFEYRLCPQLRNADALDMIANAWLSCKPLVDLAK